jgi:hypothetical protein
MATVPQYQIGQVKDRPVSGGFQQIQTNSDAFGASIAQAKIQQGQAISQLGDQAWEAAFKQRDVQDQATLRERDNLLSAKIRELISDEGGYLSLKGRNAIDAKADIERQLEEYRKDLGKDLDQRIVGKYNQVADQRLLNAFSTIDGHNRREGEAWNQAERVARVESSIQNFAANFGNDAAMKLEYDLGLREVNSQLLDVYGIDASNPKDESEQAIVNKSRLLFTSKAHEAAIENYLANDMYQQANDHFNDNKGAIDATKYDEITKLLNTYTRVGEINSKVNEIRDEGGDITMQLAKARSIDDPVLSADVVKEIKARFNEDNEIRNYNEGEAKKRVDGAIANGARTRSDIDPADWDAMGETNQKIVEDIFQQYEDAEDQRQDEIKLEKEQEARDNVYNKLARGLEITSYDLMEMSGPDYYQYKKNVRADLLLKQSDEQKVAYDKVNDLMADGLTYAEIQKDHKELWEGMSGEAQRQLKAILDTDAEKAKDDEQRELYDNALAFIAETDPTDLESEQAWIGEEMYRQMGGLYALAVKEKIQQVIDQDVTRTRTAAQRAEDDAYQKVLVLMVEGATKEDLPEGLWKQMSGTQQNSIQNAINTEVAAVNKAQLTIKKQENYVNLFQIAETDPAAFQAIDLKIYSGLLSDGNMTKLLEMQANPDSVKMFLSNEDFVKQALGSTGLDYAKESLKDSDDGRDIRRFLAEVDKQTAAHFTLTGNQPSQADFQGIVTRLMTDIVWNAKGTNKEEPLILAMDNADDLFVKVPRMDGSGKTDNMYLSEIKDTDQAFYQTILKNNFLPMTQQNIVELSTVPRDHINSIVKNMKDTNFSPINVENIRKWYYAVTRK